MKTVLFASIACVAASEYNSEWENFKSRYAKVYGNQLEEDQRFGIFKTNLNYINETNSKGNSFKLGITEFADQTVDEFSSSHFGVKPPAGWNTVRNLGTHGYDGEVLAAAVDWVAKGAVTPVKNQGQCGSCWSFSTTGSLEGAWEIATGKLVSLSEQEFVDCDKVDDGCQGGLMDNAFEFAENHDLCTEASYKYEAKGGTCQTTCTVGIPKGGVTGFKDVEEDNVQAMMSAVQQQPVSIAIEADKTVFQFYNSGILKGNCGSTLDHGVLLVGYGTEDGEEYWKVKNSWGSTWGEEGYIRLERKTTNSVGECGLLQKGSYPVVEKSAEVVV